MDPEGPNDARGVGHRLEETQSDLQSQKGLGVTGTVLSWDLPRPQVLDLKYPREPGPNRVGTNGPDGQRGNDPTKPTGPSSSDSLCPWTELRRGETETTRSRGEEVFTLDGLNGRRWG